MRQALNFLPCEIECKDAYAATFDFFISGTIIGKMEK
jgi:hypothetical protein